MLVSLGDFKPNEISQLIENKDPLGLNADIDSYSTIKNNTQTYQNAESNSEEPEINMEYDAILHYLKMVPALTASNINNNANSNKATNKSTDKEIQNKEDTTPVSQVNTRLTSISSGNLACKVSFKSFENIQQSRKRSCTNSCNSDEILGTSSDPNLNLNTDISSNSNELIEEFNTKTNEITKAMNELHFSTIDLRNKLSRGRVNNNHPIITQVTGRENITANAQVRVDIYPPPPCNHAGGKSGDSCIRR